MLDAPAGVDRVFVRVTGPSAAVLEGRFYTRPAGAAGAAGGAGSVGGAELLLLSPAGIAFGGYGPGLTGSAAFSTANAAALADAGRFTAGLAGADSLTGARPRH